MQSVTIKQVTFLHAPAGFNTMILHPKGDILICPERRATHTACLVTPNTIKVTYGSNDQVSRAMVEMSRTQDITHRLKTSFKHAVSGKDTSALRKVLEVLKEVVSPTGLYYESVRAHMATTGSSWTIFAAAAMKTLVKRAHARHARHAQHATAHLDVFRSVFAIPRVS